MLMLEPLKLPFLAAVNYTFALLKIYLQREGLGVRALPGKDEGFRSLSQICILGGCPCVVSDL